jgi:hypothetical protein
MKILKLDGGFGRASTEQPLPGKIYFRLRVTFLELEKVKSKL